MDKWTEFGANKPPGRRIGRSTGSDAAKRRKIAVAKAVLRATLEGRPLHQKADLEKLPECEGMKTGRGIGDFLGKGKGGLDLDLTRDGDDWLIKPDGWHAYKAWDYLKAKANDEIEAIAKDIGFDSVVAIDSEIIRLIENRDDLESDSVSSDDDIDALLDDVSDLDD